MRAMKGRTTSGASTWPTASEKVLSTTWLKGTYSTKSPTGLDGEGADDAPHADSAPIVGKDEGDDHGVYFKEVDEVITDGKIEALLQEVGRPAPDARPDASRRKLSGIKAERAKSC